MLYEVITDWSIVNEMRREELTNNALAERLGVSEGTVRQRVEDRRADRQVAEAVGGDVGKQMHGSVGLRKSGLRNNFV